MFQFSLENIPFNRLYNLAYLNHDLTKAKIHLLAFKHQSLSRPNSLYFCARKLDTDHNFKHRYFHINLKSDININIDR